MWLIVGVTLCLLLGFLIVSMATGGAKTPADISFVSCLIPCFGLGAFAVVFFTARALNIAHIFKADFLALILLTMIHLVMRRSRRRNNAVLLADFDLPPWLHRSLAAVFVACIFIALYSAITRTIVHPHGDGWDAFAIWNLHARFLYLGGIHWRDGYSMLIPWSHPDYPPLLPAGIAHFWEYLGEDSPAIPAALGILFAFSTVILLYSALWRMRGRNAATLAGLTLVSTPFFASQAAAQYADIPLAFFFLATLVLLCEYSNSGSKRMLALAGLSAGFAAWTKNEGLLFLFSAIIGQALSVLLGKRPVGTRNRGEMFAFLIGALPVLGLNLWFKHYIAPPSDLFTSLPSMMAKIMTPVRYLIILRGFSKQFLRFGEWFAIPVTLVLAALYLLSSRHQNGQKGTALRASLWTLALTLAGYFAIYVITPNELYWHLRFSLSRLFLQLWPSVIFLVFSFVSFRTPHQVSK